MAMPIDFFTLQTILPFVLVLAIAYGAMEQVRMFRNRAVKTMIAVVVAFFAISDAGVIGFINSILPYAAVFFVLVFGMGFFKRSLGEGGGDKTLIIIVMVLLLLLIASIARAGGGMYEYSSFFWLIGIIIVIAVLYAAYKTPSHQR